MNRLLSEAEVEALLKGLREGTLRGGPISVGDIQVERYNFREDSITIKRHGIFNGLSDKFSEHLRNSLSLMLLRSINFEVLPVETVSFEEAVKMVPVPACVGLLTINDNEKGFSVMENFLLRGIVELYFGSPVARVVKGDRAFTPVELRIGERIIQKVADALTDSFKDPFSLEFKPSGLESNINYIDQFENDRSLLKMEFRVLIEGLTGRLFLFLPLSVFRLKEVKTPKNEIEKKFDKRWLKALKRVVLNSTVDLVVEMARIELTLHEILNLKVGDVLSINKRIDKEVPVKVQNVTKFLGIVGKNRGFRSVKITRLIT